MYGDMHRSSYNEDTGSPQPHPQRQTQPAFNNGNSALVKDKDHPNDAQG